MKNARERMDVTAAYRQVGSYRGAAAMCGTTHKTVKRIVDAAEAALRGQSRPDGRQARGHNYDPVSALVAEKLKSTQGRISAKRLLPLARAEGYVGLPVGQGLNVGVHAGVGGVGHGGFPLLVMGDPRAGRLRGS